MSKKQSERARQDYEPPPIFAKGWRYHHLGIPTSVPHPQERHLKHLKLFVRGFETSPFGVEWMRFEPRCEIHELIKQVPHIAFEVDEIEQAIVGFKVIYPISSPSEGVRSAMIVHDGAPIELIEFSAKRTLAKKKRPPSQSMKPSASLRIKFRVFSTPLAILISSSLDLCGVARFAPQSR